MMKGLLIFILFIVLSSIVSATCSVSLDKTSYAPLETATWIASCDTQQEKSQDYIMYWFNGSGVNIYNNTGTTPANVGQQFSGSYVIPSGSVWVDANVTLTGTNLEGHAYFNVSGASTSALLITSIQTTGDFYVNQRAAVNFIPTNYLNEPLDNVACKLFFYDEFGNPKWLSDEFSSYNGMAGYSDVALDEVFLEDTDYSFTIRCHCDGNQSNSQCFNGATSYNYIKGESTISFRTSKFLEVTTLTDKSDYEPNEELTVCANITNNLASRRIPLDIYYDIRCGSDEQSTDRIILESGREIRGISGGSTQLQCYNFKIPHTSVIDRGATNCYASTIVTVIDGQSNPLVNYPTSSPFFTLSPYDVHPSSEWIPVSDDIYTARLNLTYYNVTGKQIHASLNTLLYNAEFGIKEAYYILPDGTRVNDLSHFYHDDSILISGDIHYGEAVEIILGEINSTLYPYVDVYIVQEVDETMSSFGWLPIIIGQIALLFGSLFVLFILKDNPKSLKYFEYLKVLFFGIFLMSFFTLPLFLLGITLTPLDVSSMMGVMTSYTIFMGILFAGALFLFGLHLLNETFRVRKYED